MSADSPGGSPRRSALPRSWSIWGFGRKSTESESGSEVEPYPGLVSFQDRPTDRHLFRGRESESEALRNLVQAEDLVLLFSRSGLGKTSLINAGIMEPLRGEGYFPVVVRLTHDPDGRPLESVYECIEKEAARPERPVAMEGARIRGTLWEYFNETRFLGQGPVEAGKSETLLRPLLILDQFEELFTRIRDGHDDGERRLKVFVEQLADLIHNRMPAGRREELQARLSRMSRDDEARKQLVSLLYSGGRSRVKILIAMREDYLAELETLKPHISGVFQHSFRLDPLTKEQARKAIEEPCAVSSSLGLDTFGYAAGVVDEMLEFLSRRKVAGRWVPVDCVEPAQLQILCRHLQKRRRENQAVEITKRDLGGEPGMKRVIRSYYIGSIRRFPLVCLGWNARRLHLQRTNLLLFNRPRLAARRLCEHGLITPDSQRNSLALGSVAQQFGLTQAEADLLVECKLLRVEERLGSRFYELSHDTLIEPVQTSRRRRKIRELLVRGGVLAAIPLAVLFQPELEADWEHRKVLDTGRNVEERTELLTTLVSEAKALNFRKLNLPAAKLDNRRLLDIELPDAQLPGANFANSALHRASFARANLSRADFSYVNVDLGNFARANLTSAVFIYASAAGASFKGANLTAANFTGAILPRASFTNAILRRAIFNQAKAGNADFTGADLTEAELEEADCTGAKIDRATFANSAWWLGYWSPSQIRQLKLTWPVERFSAGPRYPEQIRALTNALAAYPANDVESRGIVLNNLAWHRATHGSRAGLTNALNEVGLSLRLRPDRLEGLDTYGYIQLRLGNYPAARSNFQAAIKRSDSAGYVVYHLGLACDYLSQPEEALRHYAHAMELKYRPSYELVLTPPRVRPGLTNIPMSPRNLLMQQSRAPISKK